ncbi:lysine 2,3-aminomutase [Martelella endophytica]|uniref:Lysine 2,3-aminomutase n=1 Tax=Martelella endophytica TaxID=1486262 RepID=A0A0D5LTM1_MAREN|nr:lysine 2,3-aminomutase [Martelella endophytica]
MTGTAGLVEAGLVPPDAALELRAVEENFRIRIPAHVREQMQAVSPEDPVFRQYVPDVRELDHRPEEMDDPIGDGVFEKVKGITHRYPDRVLLKPTHTCQVYCRFCFRREKVGHPEEALSADELEAAFDYIRANEAIFEVILTGGDPLVLSDRRLGDIMDRLGTIPHLGVIRLHTRVPLVEPDRVGAALVAALKRAGKAVDVTIHINHPAELTEPVKAGLALLADNGIPLLSQTVLLKGVNDDATVLAALFRGLVANRVKPYYLHHLDKARGVSHFRVPIARGQEIMRELRGRVSGICQPTYVLDIPGGHGKVPIGPDFLREPAKGYYQVTDYLGKKHEYRDDG